MNSPLVSQLARNAARNEMSPLMRTGDKTEHSSTAHWQESNKEFFIRAIIDLYRSMDGFGTVNVDAECEKLFHRYNGMSLSLTDTEISICKERELKFKNYAKTIIAAKGQVIWLAEVRFPCLDAPNTCKECGAKLGRCSRIKCITPPEVKRKRYQGKVTGLERAKSCELYRHEDYGAYSFMECKMIDLPISLSHALPQITFFENGITFGGKTFKVFHCNSKSNNNNQEDLKERVDMSIVMFAEDSTKKVDAVRKWVGDDEGILPMKLNERMALVLSPTYPCCSVYTRNISIKDDIRSSENKILTDGCGFISITLLKDPLIPIIKSGVSTPRPVDSNLLPSVLQVRLRCHLGLFKGCLIVTSDEDMCKPNCVVFTNSMLKMKASKDFHSVDPDRVFQLAVNNTFEHSVTAKLNKNCCLLLNALGVPSKIFEDLMRNDLEKLVVSLDRRRSIYSLIKPGVMADIRSKEGDFYKIVDDEQDEISYGDEVSHDSSLFALTQDENDIMDVAICSSQFNTHIACADEETRVPNNDEVSKQLKKSLDSSDELVLFNFMCHGGSLNDPYHRKILRTWQQKKLKSLSECRIRLPGSTYLIGVPDHYEILEEGEVFVILMDTQCAHLENKSVIVTGPVLVTRNPMNSPEHIRKLNAVSNEQLAALFSKTCGGVIVFSTKGLRSDADFMSGGDFDGDEYLVIHGQSDTDEARQMIFFMSQRDVGPSDDTTLRERPQPKSFRKVDDLTGMAYFVGHWKNAKEAYLGKLSNQWLASAELDPNGPNSEVCRNLQLMINIELDKHKTGDAVSKIAFKKCMTNVRPAYWAEKKKNTSFVYVECDSIVAKMHALVAQKHAEIFSEDNKADYRVNLDPDYRYDLTDDDRVNSELSIKWRRHVSDFKSNFAKCCNDNSNSPADASKKYRELISDLLTIFYEDAEASYEELKNQGKTDQDKRLIAENEVYFKGKCRKRLADLVYYHTYEQATSRHGGLSVCWKICADELHSIKMEKVTARTQPGDEGKDAFLFSELVALL